MVLDVIQQLARSHVAVSQDRLRQIERVILAVVLEDDVSLGFDAGRSLPDVALEAPTRAPYGRRVGDLGSEQRSPQNQRHDPTELASTPTHHLNAPSHVNAPASAGAVRHWQCSRAGSPRAPTPTA